jgi:hypothetical protein
LAATLGDAFDQPAGGLDVELSRRQVIEKEKRLGALDDKVIDAHGDQIDADVITTAGGLGNQKLGTDAVGGGDEQRVRIPGGLEIEQAAEAAKLGIRARPLGCRRQRLDGFDEGVAGIDIDAGRFVTRAPG